MTKNKRIGKIFLLINAGQYTVDITLNQIIDIHGNLKILSSILEGPFGSTNINKEIIKIINEIIGKQRIEKLKITMIIGKWY